VIKSLTANHDFHLISSLSGDTPVFADEQDDVAVGARDRKDIAIEEAAHARRWHEREVGRLEKPLADSGLK